MKALNIMLIGIVLTMLLVGCVKQSPVEEETGVSLAPETTPEPEAPVYDVEVSLTEWAIKPTRVVADAGQVTILVTNDGSYYHEFAVEGNGVEAMIDDGVESETSAELTIELEAGTYKLVDPIPGNEEKGMVAELVVS